MTSNHLILCPLLFLPSILPRIRVFSNDLALHIRWPKYCSFSFSIRSFSEYSGLISFRMDWFDLLAVQGVLKSLLQHHDLKASILWGSAFFMVQLYNYFLPFVVFPFHFVDSFLCCAKVSQFDVVPLCVCVCVCFVFVAFAFGVRLKNSKYQELCQEYVKVVYCHPAYLTYMQSAS